MENPLEEGFGLENLHSCIEKFECGSDTFYCDTRYGTEIPPDDLAPYYKQSNITFCVKPVQNVISVIREGNNFFVSIDDNQTIRIMFYKYDKTFICRDYDPRRIIPAILSSEVDFFVENNHPSQRFGYVARYDISPVSTYHNEELNVDVRYQNAIDELEYGSIQIGYESDKSVKIVYESDESSKSENHSECGSCQIDEPDENDVLPITQEELDELDKTFGPVDDDDQKIEDMIVPLKKIKFREWSPIVGIATLDEPGQFDEPGNPNKFDEPEEPFKVPDNVPKAVFREDNID